MEISALQHHLKQSSREMQKPFTAAAEIVMAMVEELGEVSQEIALLEQIGSKTEWEKGPSVE